MSKTGNDILLIKKYLAGELDARAMHELERRALDDPFLADAIEGYEHAGGDQQKNLADLSARLQNRTDKKVKMLAPVWKLSIAASMLVIIGIGAWLMIRSQNSKQDELKQVAVNIKQAPKTEQPTISAPVAVPQARDTNVRQKAIAFNKYTAPATVSSHADADVNQSPTVAELQVNEVSKADSTGKNLAAAKKAPSEIVAYNRPPADKQPVTDQLKSTPAANDAIVQSLNANKATARKSKAMVPETLLTTHNDNLAVNPSHGNYTTLIGKVTGNNQPLEGAIVKMAGADFGVVTDANGKFILHNVPDNKSLLVKSLGYASKQVKLNGRDSINVSLEPTANSLAEVVVTKPIVNNTNDDNSSGSVGVHPSAGWKALNSYLDKNAVSPENKIGKVILSFMVGGRGSVSGFKVIQSLGNATDQKAIDLISSGPGWTGNIDGQPREVKVTVSFH